MVQAPCARLGKSSSARLPSTATIQLEVKPPIWLRLIRSWRPSGIQTGLTCATSSPGSTTFSLRRLSRSITRTSMCPRLSLTSATRRLSGETLG